MRRKLLLFSLVGGLVFALLTGVSFTARQPANALAARIARVEAGLLPAIVLKD